MDIGSVHTQIVAKVATLTFFHPASNSLPSNLLKKMTEELISLGQNEEVHVIVLKSGGAKTFCAGASFEELLVVDSKDKGTQFFMGFAHLINAIRSCTKVVIGLVQGKAVGGGVGLLSACDYCLATEEAAVKLSELFIGIGAFVIEPAVTRKVGKSAFSTLALEATEWHPASWGLAKGLFSKVFSSIEEMQVAAEKLSTALASYSPEALFEMKKVFWEGTEHWDTLLAERAAISGKLVLSKFTKETLHKLKK
jgi:methylglutaconyl-CoA hydratase